MKKILFIISILLFVVSNVTWLYFKNLASESNSSAKILSLIPDDAALVFEYKNEDSFYEIFKNFTLFRDILGDVSFEQLSSLKSNFINDPQISESLDKSKLYISIHKTAKNKADFLIVAPLPKTYFKDNSLADLIQIFSKKFVVKTYKYANEEVYEVILKDNTSFKFIIRSSVLIGSYDLALVKRAIDHIINMARDVKNIPEIPRNQNSIANLHINFSRLPDFISNFSRHKNHENLSCLKNFKASAILNINYQSDAFMFSGITIPDTINSQYANLFLNQQPGKLTLDKILPIDGASYCAYFVSEPKIFQRDLHNLFKQTNIYQQLKNKIENISKKHSINIEGEFSQVLGNEFGVVQLASGEKMGVVKIVNSDRAAFLLSTISSETQTRIRRYDDSKLLYYFFGEPFLTFERPYFATFDNYLIVSNSQPALKSFLTNYEQQKLLSQNEKYIHFQQYLSNQGNIFYFLHNKNAKKIINTFLSNQTNQVLQNKGFQYKNFYGLSMQFSADKNKFYTNLYMNMPDNKIASSELADSLYIDSLNKK